MVLLLLLLVDGDGRMVLMMMVIAAWLGVGQFMVLFPFHPTVLEPRFMASQHDPVIKLIHTRGPSAHALMTA